MIREVQPAGWHRRQGRRRHDRRRRSSARRRIPATRSAASTLLWGDSGIDYDFGELLARQHRAAACGSIRTRTACSTRAKTPLAGVTIQLLDPGGNVIRTTTTNAQGEYEFDDLAPGVYAVRELQPGGLLARRPDGRLATAATPA